MTRPRRTASEKISTATVSRGPPSDKSGSPESMRLTVKTSSNKLREATRADSSPNSSTVVQGRNLFADREAVGKRARNVRKSYVMESESDEDEEMDGDEDDDPESQEEEEDDEMDAEDDGLGEEDADGDVDMDIPLPLPAITVSKAQSAKAPILPQKLPAKPDNKKGGQKEAESGSDDEELSDLGSDMEDVDEEEGMQIDNEEDAEGEDDENEVEEDAEEDDDLDSDDETPMGGSRASTPDLNKLTKRQRARLEEGGSGHLMALPDGKWFPFKYPSISNHPHRGSSQEAPYSRGTCNETSRNGTQKKELERKAQRGRKSTPNVY